MPLTSLDRALLQRCIHHQPGAWNDFVDRFLGLIYHVIHHTAHHRSIPLNAEDTEDVAAEILLQLVANDYAVFRKFRGHASLATYMTVIARRICVHELAKYRVGAEGNARIDARRLKSEIEEQPKAQVGLESLEEVGKLLRRLPTRERRVVRLFYFEGRNYEEISTALNIPVNSIGPILSRARRVLRKNADAEKPVRSNEHPDKK